MAVDLDYLMHTCIQSNQSCFRYYCNKCQREYQGSPKINYENPSEELGEDVILVERGEYKSYTCNVIAISQVQ
jgi:hypothetical protein